MDVDAAIPSDEELFSTPPRQDQHDEIDTFGMVPEILPAPIEVGQPTSQDGNCNEDEAAEDSQGGVENSRPKDVPDRQEQQELPPGLLALCSALSLAPKNASNTQRPAAGIPEGSLDKPEELELVQFISGTRLHISFEEPQRV